MVNADNKQDFEQLLRNADRALLHVKSNGRNGICVYEKRSSSTTQYCNPVIRGSS
ncbi:GGDEF domain-containing protein [Vibrio sinaloensis]|nr:GGDEF domain-containing protein [Vibrio sinaloensis]